MPKQVPLKESDVTKLILLQAPRLHCHLMRNNVGCLEGAGGQYVTYGLGKGSSDLIGWTICNAAAIFTAVEVKQVGKKPTPEQQAFLDAVNVAGGIGCVAYSIDDLKEAIEGWDGD